MKQYEDEISVRDTKLIAKTGELARVEAECEKLRAKIKSINLENAKMQG
jgi:hypothetical protein